MPCTQTEVNRIRKILGDNTHARLSGRGRYRCFRRYDPETRKLVGNVRFSGLTKRLEACIYSKAKLPISKGYHVKRTAEERRRWKGKTAGFRRGTDIDRELSKVANSRTGKVDHPKKLHRMTRLALAALRSDGLKLVRGQHAVVRSSGGVATAIDLICVRICNDDPDTRELILVEIKTGYDKDRMRTRYKDGHELTMKTPLNSVSDNWCHRHMAQLASTWRMFVDNEQTIQRLHDESNIRDITGMLIYVTERDIEAHALPEWWANMSSRLVHSL